MPRRADVRSTIERHRERFRTDAGDRGAFEALEEHLFLAGDWEALMALYERRLTALEDPSQRRERADVLFRIGQVWQERIGQVDRAAARFRAALRADPQHRAAMRHLRALHSAREQWEVALQIAEAEAALPLRTDERAALLAEMGSIWLEHMSDPEQAMGWFERALGERPDLPAALEGRACALAAAGRAEEAATAWEHAAEQLEGPARAAAQVALARLRAGDPDAAAALYRRALVDDPRHPEALEGLAADARRRGDAATLLQLAERRFDVAGATAQRLEIALEAGRLRLDGSRGAEEARAWLARAAELAGESPRVLAALADCERPRGDSDALLECLERLAAPAEGEPPVTALLEAAALRADGGEDERALAHLQRALAIAPENPLVLEALGATLARLGRLEPLVEVLERRAVLPGSDAAARATALAELGDVLELQLDDRERATRALERAFELRPQHPGVAARLEELHRKGEAWQALRELLERAAIAAPEPERPHFLCALGGLLAERWDDADEATSCFERALELEPACPAAHRGLQSCAAAVGDDEGLLRAWLGEVQVVDEPERFASLAARIARALEVRGDWPEALQWAERWCTAAPRDPEALRVRSHLEEALDREPALLETLARLDPLLAGAEQAEQRRRAAALHARAGRTAEAIRAHQAALQADPRDVAALEALVELHERAGALEALAEARAQLAPLLPLPQRADCLQALAALRADRLGDLDGAIEALRELAALDLAPPDVDARLEGLLERAGRAEALAEHLHQRALRLGPETTEGHEAELRRAALLVDPLARYAEAADAYRAALARAPDSGEAWEGLERALRAAGDPEPLASLLAERAREAPDAALRARAGFERAVLLEEELDRGDEAAAIYRDLVASDPDPELAAAAARRLEMLLERAGAWPALRAHLEAQLARCARADSVDLHVRIAQLCRERQGDAESALAHMEAAAELVPGRADLWSALTELYGDAGRGEDLLRALEAELGTGPPLEREVALRSRATELARTLGEEDRARAHAERLLEVEPTHAGASGFLLAIWEREGRADAVVRLLEEQLRTLAPARRGGDSESEHQRAALRLRIATLRATELDDLVGAIAALEPALAEVGPRATVAEPLADLYDRGGYSEDLLELCRRAADAAETPGERANWLVRLGDALCARKQEREAARIYHDVLECRPDDRRAQVALCEIYRRQNEPEPLARLLQAQLAHASGADEIEIRLELAGLLAGALSRGPEALVELQRVLQLAPDHGAARARALDLAEQVGDEEALLSLLDDALAHPQPLADRAALLARRGRQLARGDRLEEAVAALREALRIDSEQPGLRRELRAALESRGDWPGVLDCLLAEYGAAPPEERAPLLERAGAIAAEQLSPDAELTWLERLRREQPSDPSLWARIADAHRRAGRPEAMLRALEEQSALVEGTPAWRALALERAAVLERELGARARAARVLETVRATDHRDAEVLRALERLYRELARPRERVEAIEDLLAVVPEPEQVALRCEAASLCAGPLADARRAAAHLLAAVAATPPGGQARVERLRALGSALRSTGPPDAWARCAEAELAALDPEAAVFEDRRRELQAELARVYERDLARPGAALQHLRPLVTSLARATGDGAGAVGDALEEAEAALIRLLRSRGSWLELEARLAARLARRPEDPQGWLELARLRDERLRAPARAAEAYRRALAGAPDCLPALRGLRGAAERVGDWAEVAQTLESELEHPELRASGERAALLHRLGDVCRQHLHSTTRASRAYAAALEANPGDLAALRSLEELLEAMEDWRGALELYESEIEMLGESDAPRRHAVWLRIASLALGHTADPARARRAYGEAAALAPLAAPAQAALAALHREAGDLAAYAEAQALWCDAPAAGAGCADHVALADVLEELGDAPAALARAQRALDLDERYGPAWDAAARLREALGEPAAAAEALARAADCAGGAAAAQRLLRAARMREADDPETAAGWLREAASRDPGCAAVHASRARLALAAGALDEAEGAAALALDLSPPPRGAGEEAQDAEAAERRLACALIGGQAASQRGRPEPAARFFALAVAEDPENAEALAGSGETLAALGDLDGARRALEPLLARAPRHPNRALHLAIVGAQLAATGDSDAAAARLESALEVDPHLEEAHRRLVELHEAAGDLDAGIACLERWASAAGEPARFAERLLRAAEWEIAAGGREASAESHLRQVLEAAPDCTRAWQLLVQLLWRAGRNDDALEVASRALETVQEPAARAALGLVRGRALERRGERGPAAEAFAAAVAADPRCAEAALARARLLRALGEWRPAAEALEQFAEGCDDPAVLPEVYEQLGRLRAGPLEDVEGGVAVYERALALDPERRDTRVALAELLSHRPQDWRAASEHYAVLLDAQPANVSLLRGALRTVRGRGDEAAVAQGLRILNALGAATPGELEGAPIAARWSLAGNRALPDPLWEQLRRAAREIAGEIARALGAPGSAALGSGDRPPTSFRSAALAAEAELTAPALLPLPDAQLGEVLTIAAALALDAESVRGGGQLLNALSSAIGRRARRRLRSALAGASLDAIAEVDFAAWRVELRALAAACALDEGGGDLRTALVDLMCEATDRDPAELTPSADLTTLVEGCPAARALLRRAVGAWLQSL